VPLIGRNRSPEDQAAKEEKKRLDEIEKARKAFYTSPAGKARLAFENGDGVFQYSLDVVNQQAIIVAMVGSATSKRTTDPSEILNSVCHEGWELLNGSFVFVQQGQESRDKFMASGQNVAIKGRVIGYYLFKRSETSRRETSKPWELDKLIDAEPDSDSA
jgi:hypothetical protein